MIVPIVAIISVFGSIVLFTSLLVNYSLKKKLIDKNMVSEETTNLFKSTSSKQNSLKWGLVILSGGIGLIIIGYLPYDEDSIIPYGIEAVSLSIGFLLYYFTTKQESSNS